jgi:hypothetical protein
MDSDETLILVDWPRSQCPMATDFVAPPLLAEKLGLREAAGE